MKQYVIYGYQVHAGFSVTHLFNYVNETLLCGNKVNPYGAFTTSDDPFTEELTQDQVGCKRCLERYNKIQKKGLLTED